MTTPHMAPSTEALGLLARENVPLLFDAITVQPNGSVVHSARETLSFSFDFLGATFNAKGKRVDDRFVLDLDANLGPLPFSAESVPARQAIQALIAANAMSTGTRLSLEEDQAIRVAASLDLRQPVSPAIVLTVVTEFLLELKPWLVRLAELLAEPSLRVRDSG